MKLPGVHDEDTRSIGQLYTELTDYLDDGWGRAHQIWVYGEVQKLSDHRSGHCYLDFVDPSVSGRDVPTLKAKCWRTNWGPMKASLRANGLKLEEGSVARVKGYVDLYAPRGELSFVVTELDVEALRLATMGEHARRRAALLGELAAEGLLDTNKELAMPSVPLRVGLVASKGTEGYNDFLGMLDSSGFAFTVTLARATVQGSTAPRQIVGAIAALASRGCDVVCLVRGGGSQSDLATFDDERVARAIATCPVPVLTGVGHTGDVSVADLVAHAAHRTPTACAEALATIVRNWYADRVAGAARRLAEAAAAMLEELDDGASQARRHLVVISRQQLRRAEASLASVAASVVRNAPHAVGRAAAALDARAARLAPLANHRLESATTSLVSRRALLAAYDPVRLLERGWSITTDSSGAVRRSVEGLAEGSALVTRFADGEARSTVTEVARAAGDRST